MASTVLDDAKEALEQLVDGAAPTAQQFLDLANTWKAFISQIAGKTYRQQDLIAWRKKARDAAALGGNAGKLEILKAIKGDPMLGIMLVILTLPSVAMRQNPFWWGLQFAEQKANGDIEIRATNSNAAPPVWKVKELPAASLNQKYLIFSDIHRDSNTDHNPAFGGKGVDHFRANAQLYLHCLNYADAKGYTVIEGGDCEELWFVGDNYPETAGRPDPLLKLQESFGSYQAVFDKLASLDARGRYVRIQGNHDSFIKETALKNALKARMETNTPADQNARAARRALGENADFTVYDACVIDDVKTMMDHAVLDKLVDLAGAATTANATNLANALARGWLGMDSNDYTARCQFLVCHGHQFDFWNNPENELLGMMIANAVGVTADKAMDPLIAARGIAMQGNPFIDFANVLASLMAFNSFPARQPSIRFAHDMQHRSNSQRLLLDDIQFSETVPALWGALGLSLKGRDRQAGGPIRTPAETRNDRNINLKTPAGIKTYINRHNFNHVCLGHTHNPQSQPFANFGNLAGLVPILGGALSKLASFIPLITAAKLKTGYFNSGTAGWMEGVIWAIEIDHTGQARLVYWTDNLGDITAAQGTPLVKPQYMDWELTPLDPADKAKIVQAVSGALGTAYNNVAQPVQDVHDAVKAMIKKAQGDIADLEKTLQDFMVVPAHLLAGALMTAHSTYEQIKKLNREHVLEEIKDLETILRSLVPKKSRKKLEKEIKSLMGGDAGDAIRQQLDEKLKILREFTSDVMLSVKRRSMQGFPAGATESIRVKIPLAPGTEAAIRRFATGIEPIIKKRLAEFEPGRDAEIALQAAREAADHAGALIFSIIGDFPRSMPFFSQMTDSLDPATRARASTHPIMTTMFSTLWMYPFAGTYVDVAGVRIQSSFVLDRDFATLTIMLSEPARARRPSGYNAAIV